MISKAEILILTPEIFILTMASMILIVDTFSQDPLRKVTYYLTQLTLVLTAVLVFIFWPEQTVYAFGNSFISDGMSVVLKIGVFVIGFLYFFIRMNI